MRLSACILPHFKVLNRRCQYPLAVTLAFKQHVDSRIVFKRKNEGKSHFQNAKCTSVTIPRLPPHNTYIRYMRSRNLTFQVCNTNALNH